MSSTAASGSEVISQRALNRATFARQMLLQRELRSALETMEHLVAMQGQVPRAPYVALWSRQIDFAPDELAGLMASRQAVRAPLMRSTIHLTSARDALWLYPLLRPVLERSFFTGSPFGRRLPEMDLAPLLEYARQVIAETPRTSAALRPLLAAKWPQRDAEAMAMAVTRLLPVVQTTPRGLWQEGGQTTWTTSEAWLDQPLDESGSLDALVLRYLAAFGPASVADAQNWSGLTRLKEVFERLRPSLLTLRNEQGKELFDLPDAPRPPEETPAPVRFLPVYDNLFLGHADRSRFSAPDTTVPPYPGNGRDTGPLFVDGYLRGIWQIAAGKGAATLNIELFPGFPEAEREAMLAEGERLLAFVAPEAKSRSFAFVTF